MAPQAFSSGDCGPPSGTTIYTIAIAILRPSICLRRSAPTLLSCSREALPIRWPAPSTGLGFCDLTSAMGWPRRRPGTFVSDAARKLAEKVRRHRQAPRASWSTESIMLPKSIGIGPYPTGLPQQLAAARHAVEVVTGWPCYPPRRPADGASSFSRKSVEHGVYISLPDKKRPELRV